MTFNVDHHNKILTILKSLDSNVLRDSNAYFGGGTLLALEFGEYRWSKDIDFICSTRTAGVPRSNGTPLSVGRNAREVYSPNKLSISVDIFSSIHDIILP